MANYRFKTAEIEAMKKNILTHIEREAETKTAWRLRCAIEGQLMCCRPSKREAARLERELALYEKLTKNDLPNWQGEPTQPATPTETPRISTETAETVNVSAEGEKEAETKEMPQIFNCEWQTVEHFKAIPNIAKLAKAGIIINGVVWHTEYLDKAHKVLARVDNLGWHDDGKGFGGFQGSGVFGKTAIFKSWDNAVIATIDALTDYLRKKGTQPPQSPEAPRAAQSLTSTDKRPKSPEDGQIGHISNNVQSLKVKRYVYTRYHLRNRVARSGSEKRKRHKVNNPKTSKPYSQRKTISKSSSPC